MKSFRVFTASFMHETHSFSPVPADLDSFQRTGYHLAEAIPSYFGGTRTELGAVLVLAERHGWELIHPVSASTTPSGTVTQEAFEHVVGLILDGLRAAGSVDGILLALHGAMVTEEFQDAESELLRRVRAVVGMEVPIAVTFDIHANVGPDVARLANIVSTFRTTPHIDMFETAERAGTLLMRAMSGECKPRLVYAQAPMFYGLDMGRTISGKGPMVEVLAAADDLMRTDRSILEISVNAGFDWSDTYHVGSSVLVTHDGAEDRAQAVANRLIGMAWKSRAVKSIRLLPIDEAVQIAREPSSSPGPLLIGDFTDCPGGGTAGDNTRLLKALFDAGVQDVAFASIADPVAARTGIEAGVGASVTLSLGGKIDGRFGGEPITVTGVVRAISDGVATRKGPYMKGKSTSFGPSCLVEVGGVKIIVATERLQIDDREQFRIFGVQPETTNILACKAANHFRADFEPISRRLIYVETGGSMSFNFSQFPFRHVRRPVWPLDDIWSDEVSGATPNSL